MVVQHVMLKQGKAVSNTATPASACPVGSAPALRGE